MIRTLLRLCLGPALMLGIGGLILEVSPAHATWLSSLRPGQRLRAEGLLRVAHRPQIVIVGSSLPLSDVDERWMSSALGGVEVVNAAVGKASLQETAMRLPMVLATQPARVVLVMGPKALDDDVSFDDWGVWHPAVASQLFTPAETMSELENHLFGALSWSNALVRHRVVLRRRIRGTRGLTSGSARRERTSNLARTAHKAADRARRLREAKLDPLGRQGRALRSMAHMCSKAGVQLVVAPAPAHPTQHPGGWALQPVAQQRALVRELGVRFIEPGVLGDYVPDEYSDAIHLAVDGRRRYTLALSAALGD
jgi:hypothetical protein